MSKTSKSPKKIMITAFKTARSVLPDYWHKFSPQKFTLPQLFACLVLRVVLKTDYRGGEVKDLYKAGIEYNLGKFEKAIREKNYENDTLQRGVDSNLAVILGREVGIRNALLTMDEMIKENKKIPFSTKGLKA